jgi:hypothetical protein
VLNAGTCVLSSIPSEGGFCSSETKARYKNGAKAEFVRFGKEITGTRSQSRKMSWVRVPVKMLVLGIISSYDIRIE